MTYKYLYRALREEEIQNNNIPMPKSQRPFKDHPRVGLGSAILPFKLGETDENAVIHHQTDSNRFPTRGISTTPHLEIAKKYAQKRKVVVKINVENMDENEVKEYVVKEWVKRPEVIKYPEDDEVILVLQNSSVFPEASIEEVIRI